MVADLFKHIESESGLLFDFIPLPQQKGLEMAAQGEIDVVCVLDGDYLWNEHYNLNTTGEYLSSPALLVRPRQGGEIRTGITGFPRASPRRIPAKKFCIAIP